MTGPTIIGAQRYSDDDGSADPLLSERLAAYSRGEMGQRYVLTALENARLLVPVVTVRDNTYGDTHSDNDTSEAPRTRPVTDGHSDIALPLMVGKDGRKGVLAFTCVATMRLWQSDARPTPVSAGEACAAATDEDADALVIDVAGPVTYPIQGPLLTMLAESGTIPEPHEDPQVLARIYRVTHTEFGMRRVRIHRSESADIGIRLELDQRDDASLRCVAERLNSELAPILPGGVELSAVVRAQHSK